MPFVKPAAVADADTILLYRLNETLNQQWTQLVDTASALNMTCSAPAPPVRNWNGVASRFCREFTGDALVKATLANSAALTSAWLNSFTQEVFLKLDVLAATHLMVYGATGETEATNILGRFTWDANGRLQCFWEYDLGTNGGAAQGAGAGIVAGSVQHACIRRRRIGHIMDSSVVAMWGMDEGQGTACQDLSPNVRNITWVATPTIADGKLYKCRTFNGSTQYGTSPAVTAFRTAVDDNLTVEAWVNPSSLAAATIVTYSGTTGSAAQRSLFELAIDATGHVVVRWENDVSGFVTVTSTGTISTGTWRHISFTRDVSGGAGAGVCKIYIDGVLDSTTSALALPTVGTGTSALLSIARHPNNSRYFTGSIDEIRISQAVRTVAEILAGYTEGATYGSIAGNTYVDYFINGVLIETDGPLPPPTGGTSDTLDFGTDGSLTCDGLVRSFMWTRGAKSDAAILADSLIADHMHVNDATTLYHWTMAERPSSIDDGPYGVHLKTNFTNQTKINAIVADAGGASGARLWQTASGCNEELELPRADVAALALAELTVRFAVYLPSGNSAIKSICCWGETGFESDSTRNYLWQVNYSSGRNINFGWEFAAGSGVSVNGPMPYHGGLYIIHCVRRIDPVNPGKYIGEVWADGERLVATSNLTGPTGGSNSLPFIGWWSSSGNANGLAIDDYHVQKRALLEWEIRADAGWPVDNTLSASFNDRDTAAPVLTANSPANGATLAAAGSSLAVDVTDASTAAITQVMLAVQHTGGALEIVYKGGAYQTGYSGSTSVITGGTRFTFTRTAGWLTNPSVKLYSRDALGNEGNWASSLAYVFTPPPANLPPAIANVLPSSPGPLTLNQAITFDVTDDYGLTRVFVYAKYTVLQLWEVIHDGLAFGPKYSAGSTRTPVGTGYSYSVVRTGGWPESPTLEVLPVDLSGEEP